MYIRSRINVPVRFNKYFLVSCLRYAGDYVKRQKREYTKSITLQSVSDDGQSFKKLMFLI